jgi:hypothetical protein
MSWAERQGFAKKNTTPAERGVEIFFQQTRRAWA